MDDVLRWLGEDSDLTNLLTGGIYDGRRVGEIGLSTTPGAYFQGVLLPCALVTIQTETPFGPYLTSALRTVICYCYQDEGYNVIMQAQQRIYKIVHGRNTDERGWFYRHTGDVMQYDPVLHAYYIASRFAVIIMK